MLIAAWLPDILLAVYLLSLIVLCFVGFLVASFYRKKFQKPMLRTGFIAAIVCYLLYIPTLFLDNGALPSIGALQAGLIVAGTLATGWNSLRLYMIMRRPGR